MGNHQKKLQESYDYQDLLENVRMSTEKLIDLHQGVDMQTPGPVFRFKKHFALYPPQNERPVTNLEVYFIFKSLMESRKLPKTLLRDLARLAVYDTKALDPDRNTMIACPDAMILSYKHVAEIYMIWADLLRATNNRPSVATEYLKTTYLEKVTRLVAELIEKHKVSHWWNSLNLDEWQFEYCIEQAEIAADLEPRRMLEERFPEY